MKIKTKLCYKSEEDQLLENLSIDKKKGSKYSESDFVFELKHVSGIDEPTEEDPERFFIFLIGAGPLLIKHDHKSLLNIWQKVTGN